MPEYTPSTLSITDYHAKFFAHDLTRRTASDSADRFARVIADTQAQIDLNPHQIEAALFAFRNPLSKGAILADEVGLGKTIEAGLLIAQKWAEGKRKLLVIVPANLRKQWSQELEDKFYLPSAILETKTFNEAVKAGNLNPLDTKGQAIVICSYQFARNKEPYIRQTAWDLIVIDEAHRLRNVYKGTNKIASSIKNSVAPYPKVLLTATPLQNTLLELYGLVSIIDEYLFGDLPSYRAQFSKLTTEGEYAALRTRLRAVCKRTLRKQVLEYVPYTSRHAIVQEFYPTSEEQRLYDLVSEYLQSETLYALPSRQRHLMTLILRKLLASSTFAIASTLGGLVKKLEDADAKAEHVEAPPEELHDNWETDDDLSDEWDGTGEVAAEPSGRFRTTLTPQERVELRAEAAKLREFRALAESIHKNSKGEVLMTALRRGFERSELAQKEKKAATIQQKAIIFTESRRTQEYLFRTLQETEFAGRVMIFNGVNSDPVSRAIYAKWVEKHRGTDRVSGSPGADMRAALVDHFRDEATILIATEAAAEGINLQFCNLVVNYDLPWNPQRVEQRIGRCHRYGQKFDVVVVNFLNKSNAADQRVYQLLDEKFRLFSGVFGASDEILGAVESGVDFEKRIGTIYQQCRTQQQIKFQFDELQSELESEIAETQREAREQLLNNFDQEVIEKVKVASHDALDRFNEKLWALTRHGLGDSARFDAKGHSFSLLRNPFPGVSIHPGPYHLGKNPGDANTYRLGHPLAEHVLARAKSTALSTAEVTFDYSGGGKRITSIEALRGRAGWLSCSQFTLSGADAEDHIVVTAFTDEGAALDEGQARRLFDLPAAVGAVAEPPTEAGEKLNGGTQRAIEALLAASSERNGSWFDIEMDKLDRWAQDRRTTLKSELDDMDDRIREAKKAARQAPNLPEKLQRQRDVRQLEEKRDAAWRAYDQASRDVERQKDGLIDDVGRRLAQDRGTERLFTLRWRVT